MNFKRTSSIFWTTAAAAAAISGIGGGNLVNGRMIHQYPLKKSAKRKSNIHTRPSMAFITPIRFTEKTRNTFYRHASMTRYVSNTSANNGNISIDKPIFSCSPLESQMRKDAYQIISKSIQAVDPKVAIHTHLSISTCTTSEDSSKHNILKVQNTSGTQKFIYNESDFDNIVIVSFGKASAAMSEATCEVVSKAFPNLPMEGITIIKEDHATSDTIQNLEQNYNIRTLEGSHPVPDERSVTAAQQVLDLIQSKTEDTTKAERTLLITLISGGGSALFCSPRPPLTLQDLSETNSMLLGSGMTIQQMNMIRKRLEQGTKGGQLATLAYPCQILTCILSDVIGDPLDLIASGPTIPDDYNTEDNSSSSSDRKGITTNNNSWKDVWKLIEDFDLQESLPEKVIQLLLQGKNGELEDTPKKSHPTFSNCKTILVGNNGSAVMAAANKAKELGYQPTVLGTQIEGEAQHVANVYVAMAQHLQSTSTTVSSSKESDNSYSISSLPAALIAGGETTVTLPSNNSGKGGRNQEIGLAAALTMQKNNMRNVVLASVGTDGTDGPTDAAGALVDGQTIDRIEALDISSTETMLSGLDALKTHDAYTFFDSETKNETDEDQASLSLVKTGPTGTNVADVCVVLIK